MAATFPHRPLDLGLVEAGTASAALRWRVELVRVTPSTNADVAARAGAGDEPGLVLVAEHQTQGRGRLDRSWESSPRTSLTFSVLLRPEVDPSRWPWLPLLAGVAVVRGLRGSTDLPGLALKWPNDVLLDAGKVAGILVERVETRRGAAAVVGVGVNVATSRADLPVATATSLALAGSTAGREAVLAAVLVELAAAYQEWLAAGGDPGHGLRPAYLAECATIGRPVEVTRPGAAPLPGDAVGVDAEGRLILETQDGGRAHVGAGDVLHVRLRDR